MTPLPAPPGRIPGLEADSEPSSFWERVRVPRFRSSAPRVLLFTNGYFLQREIASACSRLDWPMLELPLPKGRLGSTAFVEALLTAVATFKPDFALTVNHLGLDRNGELLSLFEKMALPLASWFVDNPRLILHDFPGQTNPWCALFTWDKDTVAPLAARGFEAVHYLPLATDTALFVPEISGKAAWIAEVSFVGDSMVRPIATLRNKLKAWPRALVQAERAAPGFAASSARESFSYMRSSCPELHRSWEALPHSQARLDLEQFLTWEATRLYRLERVRGLLPYSPVIAGDPGWLELLPAGGWRLLGALNYYRDLPGFYPKSQVNFNATSLQMKGAVNQRVFDVPACGGFLLTDWQEQLEGLFDLGSEMACYHDPEEVAGLARHFLDSPEKRGKMLLAARERVLAEHDYTHRLRAMQKTLRRRYA